MADFPEAGRYPVIVVSREELNVLSIGMSQLDLSAGPMGILDESALRDVIRAIGYVLEADCEAV